MFDCSVNMLWFQKILSLLEIIFHLKLILINGFKLFLKRFPDFFLMRFYLIFIDEIQIYVDSVLFPGERNFSETMLNIEISRFKVDNKN